MAGVATNSIRLRPNGYLSRTFASPTNQNVFTWSAWIKRGTIGASKTLFASTNSYFYINANNQLVLNILGATAAASTAVFRDTAAWYHIVYTQNGSAQTLYVNGNSVATGTTANSEFNTAVLHNIGLNVAGSLYLDGYITEINFIDGQALNPLFFAEINQISGVLSPKRFNGAYGNNGFYLKFKDNSGITVTTIGKDFSGRGNNWTPVGVSITAGSNYDSMLDIPTNNYAVLDGNLNKFATLSRGNLTGAIVAANVTTGTTTWIGTNFVFPSTGKFYWEFTFENNSTARREGVGLGDIRYPITGFQGTFANGVDYLGFDGSIYKNNAIIFAATACAYLGTAGIAYDASTGQVWISVNNVWQNSGNPGAGTGHITIITNNGNITPTMSCMGTLTATALGNFNFGQRAFLYPPGGGFVSLCSANLPTPAIANGAYVMAATTYTGTGSALTISNVNNGVSFQPNFVWLKGRSGATDHALYDSVRGVTLDLVSNSTAAETTQATGLTAFNADGFTVGTLAKLNTAAATYIAWQWKAGGTAVSNTSGSITSQVSANTAAGFSVVTFTGTGSAATVGHGLGVAPSFIIAKRRGGVSDWVAGTTALGWTKVLNLHLTDAAATTITAWNNTAPTSSVFSIDTFFVASTYVAYCFSEVAGYSKFGSYTGNGLADGPFVSCGFKPRFIMVKASSTTGDWAIIDTSRSTFNVAGITSSANTAAAEAALLSIDILSNGFKIRSATLNNTSAATYIFAAFAENSIKYALAN